MTRHSHGAAHARDQHVVQTGVEIGAKPPLAAGGSMDGRGLAAVALRIGGLILLIGVVATAPRTLLAARAATWPGEQAEFIHASQIAYISHLGATVVLALCLLLWANWIAQRAIPETPHVQLGVDASQLLTVGLALVGLVTLIHGLEAAVSLGYMLTGKPKGDETGTLSYLWDRQAETMVKAVVDIVVGA